MPDSIKVKQFYRLESGDSLIEVVIALLLMGMMILGLVPLFSYVHSHQIVNTTRVIAYNLAENQIEQIKSTPYDFIGTTVDNNVYGNPPGRFLQYVPVTYPNSPGIVYDMYTQIRWKPDSSRITTDDLGQINDPIQIDYKDITVEVKVQYQNSTKIINDIILNTGATADYAGGELPGGNIYVIAKDATDSNKYIGNITIDLYGPTETTPKTYRMLTDTASGDMSGKILFSLSSLDSGTYTMTAYNNDNDGIMILPSTNNQSIYLNTYGTVSMTLQAAPACSLVLKFLHDGSPAPFNGTVTLQCLDAGFSKQYTISGAPSYSIPDHLWPAGPKWLSKTNSQYSLTTYPPYISSDWNGQFPNPPQNITVNVNI